MAQTPEGAEKVAAARCGLGVEEYRARRAAGFKHCTKCKGWKPLAAFNADRSRYDGLAGKCRRCNSRGDYPDDMSKGDRIRATWVRRKRTFVPPMKGKKMSEESRRKMSEAAKARARAGKHNRLGKKHTPETRKKIGEISKARTPRGHAHYAYTHGRHQRDKCDRRTTEYKDWRDAVFARDNYTCQACGDDRGGNLQAHHVKSFAAHPELRFVVSNGITFCRDCHERLHLKPIPGYKCRRMKHPHPA
jgi:5-methylcytosine-specific restriction endonuclease McrA